MATKVSPRSAPTDIRAAGPSTPPPSHRTAESSPRLAKGRVGPEPGRSQAGRFVPEHRPETAKTSGRTEAVEADSRDAFAVRLYTEYAGPLTSFVHRLTGDRHWTEDVVQETMLCAWRNADHLVDGGDRSLLPWLATVARRLVINERRRRGCRPREVSDVLLDVLSVTDDTKRVLDRMVIGEALQTLTATHREAIEDTYLRERSIDETAQARNVPPGTVKSRVYYGLRALQKTLTADDLVA